MKLTDNDILFLVQAYEALGKSRSIVQNQVLAALRELQERRSRDTNEQNN